MLAQRSQQLIAALLATNSRVMSDENRSSYLRELEQASSAGEATRRRRTPKVTPAFLRNLRATGQRLAPTGRKR